MDALTYMQKRAAGMKLMAMQAEPETPRQRYWLDRAAWYTQAVAAIQAQQTNPSTAETCVTPEPANT